MSNLDASPMQERPFKWQALVRRGNRLPVLVLLLLTAVSWVYVIQAGRAMDAMGMAGQMESAFVPFIVAWAVMMAAMMFPAALPLVTLYWLTAGRGGARMNAWVGMAMLLLAYIALWTVAGLPVYGYSRLIDGFGGAAANMASGALLIAAGAYQFANLKRDCHTRCSNPLSFLWRHWRAGPIGAARLGALHALDCIGCCAGLMLALVALGAMNIAWMATAAAIIFIEKALPGGHWVARSLGVVLIALGCAMAAMPWLVHAPLH
jgi:predicted metal-binding membrane protein